MHDPVRWQSHQAVGVRIEHGRSVAGHIAWLLVLYLRCLGPIGRIHAHGALGFVFFKNRIRAYAIPELPQGQVYILCLIWLEVS